MEEKQIKDVLKKFLVDELGVDGDALQDDSELFGDEIGLDSIDSIELISCIDDNFGVSMTGVDREHFQSVNTLTAYILAHQN
jgi:acyl carrier protein